MIKPISVAATLALGTGRSALTQAGDSGHLFVFAGNRKDIARELHEEVLSMQSSGGIWA